MFNFFIYFFLFDILESFNLSYIPSFLIENILINNSRIFVHNLSFIKIINSSFYNCTYLNNLFKTNENYLLCIKNISIYIINEKGKTIDYEYNKVYENILTNNSLKYINSKRKLNENSIKCSEVDEISSKNSLCIKCNTDLGYYPIINNKNNEKSKYIDCHLYNENAKENNLLGYYFDSEEKSFKHCYESCHSCIHHGNQLMNNCIECRSGYIKLPEITSTTNCVKKCDYYFYYTLTGNYICTPDLYCPNEASNLIQSKNKCIINCSEDDKYKFQYNGECFDLCPTNTKYNNDINKCIDKDINTCTLTIREINVNIINLNSNIINIIVKNFVDEFIYTQNHVSQFISQSNYSLVIYRNESCFNELHLNNSKIIYEECSNKIMEIYNIENPIIVIIDRLGKYGHHSTYIAFYNPENGNKLDTSFCDNITYIIFKNISSIYNKDKYDWLVTQGVDVYNINSFYYTSNCFAFKDNPKKDLLLKDRILNYYPNISLCGLNCQYKETNYISLTTKCSCMYNEKDFISFDYNINLLADESMNIFQNIIIETTTSILLFSESMKLSFLFCYQNIFKFDLFIKNIGGIIFVILLSVDIICVILFIKSGFFKKINKFIMVITELYIQYLKKKRNGKKKKNRNNTSNNIIKNEQSEKTSERLNKKNNLIKQKSLISQDKKSYFEDDTSQKCIVIKRDNSLDTSKNKKSEQKSINERNCIINVQNKQNVLENLYDNKKNNNIRETIDINNSENENIITEAYMKNYLILSPDEMDYYESLEKDKRAFLDMLKNLILEKNIIFETFFVSEETEPIYIKIIELVLYLLIIFVACALLFFSENIVMLYEMNIGKYLLHNLPITSTECFIAIHLRKTLRLILIDKDSIREKMKIYKKDIKEMKNRIIKLIGFIKFRYITFIILNFILVIVSWYYISVFNNAYPNIKIVWIIESVILIFVVQLYYAILAVLSILLRILAIKCKFNFIFVCSKYLYDLL